MYRNCAETIYDNMTLQHLRLFLKQVDKIQMHQYIRLASVCRYVVLASQISCDIYMLCVVCFFPFKDNVWGLKYFKMWQFLLALNISLSSEGLISVFRYNKPHPSQTFHLIYYCKNIFLVIVTLIKLKTKLRNKVTYWNHTGKFTQIEEHFAILR